MATHEKFIGGKTGHSQRKFFAHLDAAAIEIVGHLRSNVHGRFARDAAGELLFPGSDGDACLRFHADVVYSRDRVLPVRLDYFLRFYQALDCAGGE